MPLIIWIFYLLALTGCLSVPVNSDGSEVFTLNGISVYQSLGGPGQSAQAEMKQMGIGNPTIIYGRDLHSGDGLSFDPDKLAEALRRSVPKNRNHHLIVLDWEGTRMEQIFEGALSKDENYHTAKAQLLSAYRLTKQFYPQYTVGFYGFPIRDYWSRDENWTASNTELADFLQEVDALFPSLYDFYETTSKNYEREYEYIRENVEEALRLGMLLNKPVYPFIWHRYHPSNQTLGHQPIPFEEFKDHLKTITQTSYEGTKINGIIWWSAERYFFKIGKTETYNNSNFDERNGQLIQKYLDAIIETLSDH